ncbi:hypothetical protein [Piscirickettsia salmonis]|uniref:hypothetical protein n=1 Tax=Piscirickettsia salmonis TaxID=1238 RepID=UPI0007C8C0C6|nr:hypothetical protein A0O36_00875 [Piscirickettsiaceae bacterium NZ-RLO1]
MPRRGKPHKRTQSRAKSHTQMQVAPKSFFGHRPKRIPPPAVTTKNIIAELIKGHEKHLAKNPIYVSIEKDHRFDHSGAQYTLMQLNPKILNQPDQLHPEILNPHFTIPHLFDNRSLDSGRYLTLEYHIHLTFDCVDSNGEMHHARIYCKYRPEGKNKFILVDEHDTPLDQAIQDALINKAKELMQPIISLVDDQINRLETKKSRLEKNIAEKSQQLHDATRLEQKIPITRQIQVLINNWFALVNKEDYKEITEFRNNNLKSTDEDGFTTHSSRSGLTKNSHDEMLKRFYQEHKRTLQLYLDNLLAEKAKIDARRRAAANPQRQGKKAKPHHKKRHKSRFQSKSPKTQVKKPKFTLKDYLDKAQRRFAAYLNLSEALARGDLVSFNEHLQDKALQGECILFFLSADDLDKLYQPENSEIFENIVTLQEKALLTGACKNPQFITTLLKKLLQSKNLKGLLILDKTLSKIGLSADEIYFKHKRKSLLHLIIDLAHEEGNDREYAKLLANLFEQGFYCKHSHAVIEVQSERYKQWLSSLQYATYSEQYNLALAFTMHKGIVDRLAVSTRQEVMAIDFVAVSIATQGPSTEKFLLLLAYASKYAETEFEHASAFTDGIYAEHIENSSGNKLAKTMNLLHLKANLEIMTSEYHQLDNAKSRVRAYSLIQNTAHERSLARVRANPALISRGQVAEASYWFTMLKLFIEPLTLAATKDPGHCTQWLHYLQHSMQGIIQKHQQGQPLITNLKPRALHSHYPAPIIEILASKILALHPESTMHEVIMSIQQQVITTLQSTELLTLKNPKPYIDSSIRQLSMKQPEAAQLHIMPALQAPATTDVEHSSDQSRHGPAMLFFQSQQAATASGPQFRPNDQHSHHTAVANC